MNNANVNFKANNTKKELLDIISRLKKSEIISMINEHNKNVVNNNNNNLNVQVRKETIKIPENLGKIKFNNMRGKDNNQYKGV
tara:strand:+ start:3385 stop:3633 length:249 start_codon:yes stop_codon:yes gene_type:complete